MKMILLVSTENGLIGSIILINVQREMTYNTHRFLNYSRMIQDRLFLLISYRMILQVIRNILRLRRTKRIPAITEMTLSICLPINRLSFEAK